jgi:hypothetical protein
LKDDMLNLVLNTNRPELIQHLAARKRQLEINNKNKELQEIKDEMKELKDLVYALLNKGN